LAVPEPCGRQCALWERDLTLSRHHSLAPVQTDKAAINLIMRRVGRVLALAEMVIAEDQFPRFRRLMLEEFGDRELKRELRELLSGGEL